MDEHNNFKEISTQNKRITLNKLIKNMNKEKLRVLQTYLNESNINYDTNIKDYHKLIAYLKRNLDIEQKRIVLEKCNEIDGAFENLIAELSKGSTTAFNKFLKTLSTIIKPVSVGLALNTVIKIAPTPVTKIVPIGVSLLYTTYKLCKNHKYKKIVSKMDKLNQKLQDKEFKYDSDGKLIDTRFTLEEQALIRAKLKEMHVDFLDTGYQSLRTIVYSLDYEQKLQLVMALDGKIDRHEFEKELKKYNDLSIFEKRKFFPVLTSLTSGALTTLGVLDFAKIFGLAGINGVLTTSVTNIFTDNETIAKIAGYMASVGTFIGFDSPIIQAESLFIGAIIGEFLRFIIKTTKSICRTFSNKNLSKQYIAIEQEKYRELDLLEQQALAQYLNSQQISKRIGETAIVELVTQYIKNNLKVNLETRPKNIQQLGLVIQKLSSSDRNKIHKLMEEFKHFNTHKNNQFLRKLEKILKATGITALYGLAGMSVIDIFTRGEFLNQIHNSLLPYIDAPASITIELENPQVETQSFSGGFVRLNENGQYILETTVSDMNINDAFFQHCNAYYALEKQNPFPPDATFTQEEFISYFNNLSLESYQDYSNTTTRLIDANRSILSVYEANRDMFSDKLINSTRGTIEQLELFLPFLEKMIAERSAIIELNNSLSKAGMVASVISSGTGLVEERTESKAFVRK